MATSRTRSVYSAAALHLSLPLRGVPSGRVGGLPEKCFGAGLQPRGGVGSCAWLERDGVVGDIAFELRLARADVVEGLGPFETIVAA